MTESFAVYIEEQRIGDLVREQLRNHRKALGLSQDWLAKRTGLKRTTISNIENGDQGVPLDVLYRLCAGLGIEVARVLPSLAEVTTPVREEVAIDDGPGLRVSPKTAVFLRGVIDNPDGRS